MSTFLRIFGSVLVLCAVPAVQAGTFSNPRGGYAFDLPTPQWRMTLPHFFLQSSTGGSLTEADLPPQGEHTLIKISKAAGMIACIGADYEATNEHFELEGDHWNGLVTVYQEPRRTGRVQRHVLQLVAQSGDEYRLFYYAVPSSEWFAGRDAVLAQLKTLRFGNATVNAGA